MTPTLTLFSFGYWGWGTVTDKLVAAVDAIEASRGFKPPIFVDIRYENHTRAPGFSGNTFRDLIGAERFRWMRKLGNRAMFEGWIYPVDDPAAAKDLLDDAIQAAKDSRRVIFFCACKHPVDPEKNLQCHRTIVAQLVLKEAKKRRLAVDIVEWVGGEPRAQDLRVDISVFRRLTARLRGTGGAQNITLGRTLPDAELLGLPYGSIVVARNRSDAVAVMSGPATYAGGQWQLPALEVFEYSDERLDGLLAKGLRQRKALGRAPLKNSLSGS